MFNVVGFGFTSAVLLVTFGKLITDRWFVYMMIAIILFELVMFCLGLNRPLGETHQDFVEADLELSRNESTVDRKGKHFQDHSRWLKVNTTTYRRKLKWDQCVLFSQHGSGFGYCFHNKNIFKPPKTVSKNEMVSQTWFCPGYSNNWALDRSRFMCAHVNSFLVILRIWLNRCTVLNRLEWYLYEQANKERRNGEISKRISR